MKARTGHLSEFPVTESMAAMAAVTWMAVGVSSTGRLLRDDGEAHDSGKDRTVNTAYEGPVVVSAFRFTDREIRVVRPGDPDRLLDDPDVLAWNRRDDYMPYWAYLWPGAVMLAEAVAREPLRAGTRALEIGCGLGLAGLVGLARGLRVHFTDYDEAALEFVARSVRENRFDPTAFSASRMDWRDPPDDRFPLILAADVLYERRLVPLVVDVVARMLEPGGFALIADPDRASAEGLAEAVARRGLTSEKNPVIAEVPGHGTTKGTIHRVRWPRTDVNLERTSTATLTSWTVSRRAGCARSP